MTCCVNVPVKRSTATNNQASALLTLKASGALWASTEAGGDRGYDAGKNIKGRKRQLIVDTNGFVLRVLVHAADISESEGGIWLINEHREALASLDTIRVDQGYKQMFVEWLGKSTSSTVQVVEKPKDQVGFAVLPKRWVVEEVYLKEYKYQECHYCL
jgi:hypothetical protein